MSARWMPLATNKRVETLSAGAGDVGPDPVANRQHAARIELAPQRLFAD